MRLHWKDRFGDMSRTRLLPRFINLPVNEPSKNHLAGWFFRFPRKRLRFERMNLKKIMAFDEQMSQLLRLIEKMPFIQVIYFPKLILYFNIRKRPFPTPRFSLFFNISNTWDHPI